MKKIFLTLLIFTFMFLIPNFVKADTVIFDLDKDYILDTINNDYLTKAYNKINETNYKYYVIQSMSGIVNLYLSNSDSISVSQSTSKIEVYQSMNLDCSWGDNHPDGICTDHSENPEKRYLLNLYWTNRYGYYDSNIDIFANSSVEFTGFYNDNIVVNNNDKFPKLKDLLNYSSWSDFESNNNPNYTTVDLSKYHYVLLNLKDYSKKESFSSNLQVKGMVGITPIYNFGTTAKDDVIGNKIEDRCNLSYKDYTDYRLYILKSDLENKAIYAVKGCEDNSSFKFDNTLFDITYVTDDNIDDPIVTIDGKEYHTIPYNQLPSTATQNEEENYVPGESKELSFSEIVDNVTDTLSSVWSSIITFMNLFTKFFNTLPVEIRVISITTFTTACTLGIIKILKS